VAETRTSLPNRNSKYCEKNTNYKSEQTSVVVGPNLHN